MKRGHTAELSWPRTAIGTKIEINVRVLRRRNPSRLVAMGLRKLPKAKEGQRQGLPPAQSLPMALGWLKAELTA